jgi:hypothetical protein
LLEEIAGDTQGNKLPFDFRLEAIKSLGKLAGQPQCRQGVVAALQRLLARHAHDSQHYVTNAAIDHFGALAQAQQARTLFDFLSQRDFNTRAVAALHAIILRSPAEVPQLVEDYLLWRAAAPLRADVRLQGDETLVELAGLSGPRDVPVQDLERALKAIAQALAAANLHDKVAVRELAGQLLPRILTAPGAPPLNPLADDLARRAQYKAWQDWWHNNHAGLRLRRPRLTLD